MAEDDPYYEKLVITIYNKKKPHNKIKLANENNPYLNYDAEDKNGNSIEIKSVNDWYYLGNYSNVLLPMSKVGCPGRLQILYKFYDGVFEIYYSHNKFKDFEKKHINGRRHFVIPKSQLKFIGKIPL